MILDTFTGTIELEGGGELEISVEHNLFSGEFGLSIENAFDAWLFRTTTYTVESFCAYVRSKSPAFICKPKETSL